MKNTKLLYITCLLIPCLLLSDGFAQEYAARWNLPEGAKARLGRGKLNNIIFSPDGTRVAVSTPIGIWIYDAHTHEAVSLFTGIQTGEIERFLPTKPPEALTFSADALIVASAHGKRIYVWDTATGTAFGMLDQHPDTVKAIALSPDSTKLATAAGDWVVRLWDVGTGKYINSLQGHTGAVNAVAFSPDGKILASAGDNLCLWNADTGELLRADDRDLGFANRLIFSPDGKVLATGGGWDHTVRLWDVNTCTLQQTLKGHTSQIRDFAFSSDSGTLVSASSTMLLWDVRTGKELKNLSTLQNEQDKVHQLMQPPVLKRTQKNSYRPTRQDVFQSVIFSEDAEQIITTSKDSGLHIWDVETGFWLSSFSFGVHSNFVGVLVFSEDGKYLASNGGFESRIRIWNVDTATQHAVLALEGGLLNPGRDLTVSQGIKKVAGQDLHGTIRIWDAETADELSVIPRERGLRYWPLVLSPDGEMLAGCERSGRNIMELWRTDGVPLWTLEGHTGAVSKYTFSPDSHIFASGDMDGTVILWDVQTGAQHKSFTEHKESISALAFSEDSKVLASGSGNEIQIRDVETGKMLGTLDVAVNVQALAFSPDGKVLASGDEDGLIQVWDLVPTLQEHSTFRGHQGAVYVLMFSPDGKVLASGSMDGTIFLWNMER